MHVLKIIKTDEKKNNEKKGKKGGWGIRFQILNPHSNFSSPKLQKKKETGRTEPGPLHGTVLLQRANKRAPDTETHALTTTR
jgi:hypothetical protein